MTAMDGGNIENAGAFFDVHKNMYAKKKDLTVLF